MNVNTIKLQNAVAKVIKGAGFNKMLEVSRYIGIKIEGGRLYLTTTDGTNYMYVWVEVDTDEQFNISVDAEVFAKLISKTTTDEITFEATDSALVVKGNGTYTMPLELDDSGNVLVYPDPSASLGSNIGEAVTVSPSVIDAMITSLKPSLSSVEGSIYENYCVSDFIASTDRAMVSIFNEQIFKENNFMFSREFVDLLGIATEDIEFQIYDDYILALSKDMKICAKKPADTAEFDVDKMKKLMDISFDSFCRVNKSSLLALLERLALFVGAYDDGAINLEFKDDSLEVSSLKSNGIESIEYKEAKNAVDMKVKINVNRLLTQVKAYSSDTVDIYYGQAKFLKLSDGKLTQIIAYML